MPKPKKECLSAKQIANLSNVSESYVYKVKSGLIKGEKAEMVHEMLLLSNDDFKVYFESPLMIEICELALAKSKNIAAQKFASYLIIICSRIQKKL
jgi:predicted outer membrane protein